MNPQVEKQFKDFLSGLDSKPITKSTSKEAAPNRTASVSLEASITPLPKHLPISSSPLISPEWESYQAAALYWYNYGFLVIPILPGTKRPALKHEPWLTELSVQTITDYWSKHPDYEVGCITGDNIVVFDADTPESIKALKCIEESHNVKPNLVSKTQKGEHHFFRVSPDTYVKSDSHCSKEHPQRIDIKTGKGQIVLPPSTGKTILVKEAKNVEGLVTVNQDFIDSVFLMNDREVPRPPDPDALASCSVAPACQETIIGCLENIDPNVGYEDWLRVGMAIFHETNGSEEGLKMFDAWSSKGNNYKGINDVRDKWKSFRLNVPHPVTIGTLIKMAKDAGADVAAIMHHNEEDFEVCEDEVVTLVGAADKVVENALDKFSLRGMSDEIEKKVMDSVYVLDQIALLGQSTVIYAAPNTGKTLLSIEMLVQSIKQGRIDPAKIYYINVDDTAKGLVEKLRIAEEYEFHMLAEGYRDFKATDLFATINVLIESDHTRGIVIVLDTLKKFTDLMDKKICREFGMIIRRFIAKGGTVISLAHTNKNPGRDGKRVQAGTSDILDDCDCAYILDVVSEDAVQKVVEFTNKKKRGDVANSLSYCYSVERGNSYNELVLSVEQVDAEQIIPLKQAAKAASDAELISAIVTCIKDGIVTKMKLAEAAAERAQISKKRMGKVIDNYTGDDPAIHHWSFKVCERGAKVYKLHERPSGQLTDPALDMDRVTPY